MKKLIMFVAIVIPTLLMANDQTDYEIRLTEITGTITSYPLEFDLGLYLPEQDVVGTAFVNHQRVSLSEESLRELNSTHQVNGYDLSIKVQNHLIRPESPYIVPNPIYKANHPDRRRYRININGKLKELDEFYVHVRTDAWGASTLSYDVAMDTIQFMEQNSTVANQTFDLEDDGVTYHFVIARLNDQGIPECKNGLCSKTP